MLRKIPSRRRIEPRARKAEIIAAAVELARRHGYNAITREQIAEKSPCSARLINYYFTTIGELRALVIRAAVEREVIEVIAQGLALRDPLALLADRTVKMRAVAYMMRVGA